MLYFSVGIRDILYLVSEDFDLLYIVLDILYFGNCDWFMKFLRYSLVWVLVIKKYKNIENFNRICFFLIILNIFMKM